MKEFWNAILETVTRFLNMPATVGSQLAALTGVIGILVFAVRLGRRILQHLEWIEMMWLDYSRRTGGDVPKWLIEKHMKINGNSKVPITEKAKIYFGSVDENTLNKVQEASKVAADYDLTSKPEEK